MTLESNSLAAPENSLETSLYELLTPADWRDELTPCQALLEPFEPCRPESELVTPLEWATFDGAGMHVR